MDTEVIVTVVFFHFQRRRQAIVAPASSKVQFYDFLPDVNHRS